MGGICGRWSRGGVERDALKRMADTLRHRGPDDDGDYTGDQIGLASRRLSIVDLAGGRQPIANEDETIWLVFDGAIYNAPALRQHLFAGGHHFKTKTDAEVIIHLYEQHGVESLKRLRGIFAFALWDVPRRRLLIARDPMGHKPLFYRQTADGLTFASEMRALLGGSSTPELNLRAMHHLLSLDSIPESDTLIAGINKLPAGHWLLCEDGEVITRPYWELHYRPKRDGSDADLLASLDDRLVETVRSHLLSDVPVGALLGTGIESALIAAIMARLLNKPFNTFAIGLQGDESNRFTDARQIAQRYGTSHYEQLVEPNLIAMLPELMWFMEAPVDPAAFGVYALSQLASRHVKVALGGSGADAMFAGSRRHLGSRFVDWYCLLPPALRLHILEPVARRLPDSLVARKLRWLLAMAGTSAAERYARSLAYPLFSHAHKRALYSERLWTQLGGLDSFGVLIGDFNAANASDVIDRMLFTDVRARLADHVMAIDDRMGMAHSLQIRSPYADHQFAEYAAALPTRIKLKGRQPGYVLRELARRYLPQGLVERTSSGFSYPLADWFRGDLRRLTLETFHDSRLVALGYFRADALLSLMNEHAEGRADHHARLWLLLNLELWYRLFVEGSTHDAISAILVEAIDRTQRLKISRKLSA